MSFLAFGLNETATLWVFDEEDGYGNPTFAAPVQVPCRWEQRMERIRTDEGTEIMSRAKIFLDRDVTTKDYLYYGETAEADPTELADAYQVVNFEKIPGLFAEDFERKAWL